MYLKLIHVISIGLLTLFLTAGCSDVMAPVLDGAGGGSGGGSGSSGGTESEDRIIHIPGTSKREAAQESHGGSSLKGEFVTLGSLALHDMIQNSKPEYRDFISQLEFNALSAKHLNWDKDKDIVARTMYSYFESPSLYYFIHNLASLQTYFTSEFYSPVEFKNLRKKEHFQRVMWQIAREYLNWLDVPVDWHVFLKWIPSDRFRAMVQSQFVPEGGHFLPKLNLIGATIEEGLASFARGARGYYNLAQKDQTVLPQIIGSRHYLPFTMFISFGVRKYSDSVKSLILFGNYDHRFPAPTQSFGYCHTYAKFIGHPNVIEATTKVIEKLQINKTDKLLSVNTSEGKYTDLNAVFTKNLDGTLEVVYNPDALEVTQKYFGVSTPLSTGFLRLMRHEVSHAVIEQYRLDYGNWIDIPELGTMDIEGFRDTNNRYTRCYGYDLIKGLFSGKSKAPSKNAGR